MPGEHGQNQNALCAGSVAPGIEGFSDVSGDERRLDGTLDERVVEFVYGELSAVDDAALRKELEQRPDLQAQVDELVALQRNLDTIDTPEPPAEVVADIMAYAAGRNRVVRTEPVPEKRLTLADILRWLIQPQVGMAMAAMLVVAVGVYMGQSARRPTEPGSAREVKERMRPTRAVAKKNEVSATAAKAESAPPTSGKLVAPDEAVESKVAEPLEEQQKKDAERERAAAPPTAEKAAAARQAPQQELAQPVMQEAEASGEEQNAELELVPDQRAKEGRREPAVTERSPENMPVVEEPGQVVMDGAKADQNMAAGAAGSGGSAGLGEGQRKGGDKVAVRSLVDSLQRRRNDSGVAAANDRWDDIGAKKDGNIDLDNQAFKTGDSANIGLAQGAPADSSVELDDSTHKQVNIPRKERRKKVLEKKVAGKKKSGVATGLAKESAATYNMKTPALAAELEEAPAEGVSAGGDVARGEKREWVGNTYNRAVEGDNAGGSFSQSKTTPVKENAKAQVAESKFAEIAAESDGPTKPREAAPNRPAARTSVDAAWGVVPTTVPGGSLVKPVSVNPAAGSEYTAVVDKGEVKLDFGDDGVAKDNGFLSQATDTASQSPAPVVVTEAPMEPVMAESEDLGELATDEDLGGEDGELAAPMADNEDSVDVAYQQKVVKRAMETQAQKEEANEVIALVSDEKKAEKKKESKEELKKSDHATKCDERWAQLLAFEQAGEHGKALKLMKMFRTGPCEGNRTESAMDMREAQIYIASGKRSKARKMLKRLQKVPAMEQKAMDMMESIEGDGYTQ
jgi:hypothetical protein